MATYIRSRGNRAVFVPFSCRLGLKSCRFRAVLRKLGFRDGLMQIDVFLGNFSDLREIPTWRKLHPRAYARYHFNPRLFAMTGGGLFLGEFALVGWAQALAQDGRPVQFGEDYERRVWGKAINY